MNGNDKRFWGQFDQAHDCRERCECGALLVRGTNGTTYCAATLDKYRAMYGQRSMWAPRRD